MVYKFAVHLKVAFVVCHIPPIENSLSFFLYVFTDKNLIESVHSIV